MEKTLYLDCSAGISGDMAVGALIDLGADADKLTEVLGSIQSKDFIIKIIKMEKNGVLCTDFDVILENKEVERHRHPSDVMNVINSSSATDRAKSIAGDIVSILAKAESDVHGVSESEVHFHEVGGIDSITDILAVGVCMDDLGIERTVVTSLYDGKGTVQCQHGILPVPVPAVSSIIRDNKITVYITDVHGEMVTPTGAAIAAALRTDRELPQTYRILKEGFGSGKRDFGTSGYLRAVLIEPDRW